MRRSFWAWGWEERLPDQAAREALGAHVATTLGSPAAEPRPLPPLDQATAGVPAPRVAPPSEIADIGDASPEPRVRHTYGRASRDLVRGFACDFSSAPDFVCLPRSEEDVARALEACARAGIAVAPYGGGTSVVGGVEAGGRGRPACSLDLCRLSRVLEVDPVSRAARIQAGALGPDLEGELRPHGLTLRHFPQSFEFSTLGGWIATRAGGHFATLSKHGCRAPWPSPQTRGAPAREKRRTATEERRGGKASRRSGARRSSPPPIYSPPWSRWASSPTPSKRPAPGTASRSCMPASRPR